MKKSKLKQIRANSLKAFEKETKDLESRLKGIDHKLQKILKRLTRLSIKFPTPRQFKKEVGQDSCILKLLKGCKLSSDHYKEVLNFIASCLFNKIPEDKQNEKFRLKMEKLVKDDYIKEQRGDLFPSEIYRFLPVNASVNYDADKNFIGIRQHYMNDVNSMEVKMYVSASLEPEFQTIYEKMFKRFMTSKKEAEKMYAGLSLITMLTGIRPGVNVGKVEVRPSKEEEKVEIETFGLTTLTKEHLTFKDDTCIFNFFGKKGTANTFTICEKNLVGWLKDLYDKDSIFKIGGVTVGYKAFLAFLSKTGYGPSDYRKRVANVSLQRNLDVIDEKKGVSEALNEVFSNVAVDLNHKTSDGSVAVNSYCNPRITVRWLSGVHATTLLESVGENAFQVGMKREI